MLTTPRLSLIMLVLAILACSFLPPYQPAPDPTNSVPPTAPQLASTPTLAAPKPTIPVATNTALPPTLPPTPSGPPPALVYGLDRRQVIAQVGGTPDPEDLDPARNTTSADDYIGLLYAGLVRFSPTFQIEPVLAESWTVSADGKTYTFTLRPNLKFQSGQPLTTADVKYSWERAADPKTQSQAAQTYLGDIVGVKDKLSGKASEISGVKVVDDRTLTITLDAPKAYFLAKLTYPTSYVVNRRSIEGLALETWTIKPDASGPYKLREYLKDEALIFERNPAYYAPAKTPYLLYYLHPRGTSISMYQAGEIDMVYLGNDDVEHISKPGDPLNKEWQSTTSMCTSLLMLDISKPPLDDINVRRALILALDRDAMTEKFGHHTGIRADTVLPPAMSGFLATHTKFNYNPQTAQMMLAASKYAAKMPTLIYNSGGFGNAVNPLATTLIDMWRMNLRLNTQVQNLDPRKYSEAARFQHGHIVSYGWCADYPDPENFLDVLFHSQSLYNVAGYKNPAVDQLLERARTEKETAKRLQLYQQAEKVLIDEVAFIPLRHSILHILVKPYIKNYTLAPMTGVQILQLLTIEGFPGK